MKHRKILNIIEAIRDAHPEMVNIFSMGSCMNLFCILRQINPKARAYYNCSHIITKIGDRFYDITGCVSGEGYLPFVSYYSKRRLSRAFGQMINAACTVNGSKLDQDLTFVADESTKGTEFRPVVRLI